jgi:hypothetical protein
VHFLLAYHSIQEDDRGRIFLLKEGGLSVRQIMRVIELEKIVKHGYLPFTEKDVRNLFLKANKKVERSDVMDLLKHSHTFRNSFRHAVRVRVRSTLLSKNSVRVGYT